MSSPNEIYPPPDALAISNPLTSYIVVIAEASEALIICLHVINDGLVAISLGNGDVWLIDTIEHSKTRLHSHEGAVWALASKGKHLFTSDTSGKIIMWDIYQRMPVRDFVGHTNTVRGLQISGNNTITSCSRDGTLRIWDLALDTEQSDHIVLRHHTDSVRKLEMYGSLVVSGSNDNTVKVWDTSDETLKYTLTGHTASISSVAISANQIFTASLDGSARIWNHSGDCMAVLHTPEPIVHASFIKTMHHPPLRGQEAMNQISVKLATADTGGNIRIWSSSTFESLHKIAAHDEAVSSLEVCGPQMVSAGADGKVKVWDIESGSLVCELENGRGHVWKAAFCAEQVVVAAMHGNAPAVEIWENIPTSPLLSTQRY